MQPLDPKDLSDWPQVLDDRTIMRADPAVYALLHEREVARLRGESRILYVGSTGELGGASDRCRLRIYRYPNAQHARALQKRLRILLDAGVNLTFVWRHVECKQIALQQESIILSRYLEAHWELPPFNGRAQSEA